MSFLPLCRGPLTTTRCHGQETMTEQAPPRWRVGVVFGTPRTAQRYPNGTYFRAEGATGSARVLPAKLLRPVA